MALGIIGIVIALAIFLYGAYRNVATLYLAPICGVIVAAFNGMNLVEAFTNYHVSGICEMLLQVFPTIFLGAILGKIFTDCKAAASVAQTLSNKFVLTATGEKQVKRAVLVILLVTCAMTFGGVDGFVAVFAIFPIVMILAEKIGIPRRFVPAMLCLGCGANSAPGVPMINNIICMNILQTDAMAAAIPGFITFIVIEVGVYFICSRMIIRAMKKGENFDLGPCRPIEGDDDSKKPSFIISILPLLLVFVLFAFVRLSAATSITAGILLTIILMSQYLPKKGEVKGKAVGNWMTKVIDSLNDGATNGATALMTITAAAGFAAVVQHTEAFQSMVGSLMGIPVPPMAIAIILLVIIVAFTSSPPAALGVALPIIATAFIWVETPAINPNALARIASIAVSTFETLPVNGLIILTTGLAQVKIKDAYLPMFLQTVIMTLIGTVLCAVLLALFPGLA